MTLEPYEFRDPGALVADVLQRHPVAAGDALLVLVHHPSTVQDVVHVTRMHVDDLDRDAWEDGQRLGAAVRAMPIPSWNGEPPEHAVTTILARRGLAIIGPRERGWLAAWRYSNHLMHAYSGEVIVLTEHGWVEFVGDRGGFAPRLPDRATSALRLVEGASGADA
jgi:hypothetical protein